MRIKPLFIAVSAALGAATLVPGHATDWLQFGYDVAHSAFNRAETGYSTAGNLIAFSSVALSTPADSTPVFLGNVATPSGTKDLLFIMSLNGTLLAVDASNGSQVWSKQPATSTHITTGSPAIDPGLAFVYAYGMDGKVHKYKVGDGTEILTGGWPEVSTLKPNVEKGASGLSFATANNSTTYLYSVVDGYIGDAGDYQGHLTAIDLAGGNQKVFNSLCSDLTIHFADSGKTTQPNQTDCAAKRNGIWGRPGAVYDAGTNRVFITTGNGPYDVGALSWGDSVLALNPDGSGAGAGMPLDSYTPTTFANLQTTDADLGSESIAIVPSPPGTAAAYQHIAVQAGKDGCVRLLNLADLSGVGAPGHTGGELDAQNLPGGSHCATGSDSPEIKPQPAVWVNPADSASWIYVTSYGNGSAAYKIVLDGSGKPSLSQQWTTTSGTSPAVANGIVYIVSTNSIRALDAITGSLIWSDNAIRVIKWQSPIIANGRLYVVDWSNTSNSDSPTSSSLWVYKLDGAFKSGFE